MAVEWSSIDSMIKEAEEMQLSGQYINGRVFHALVAEIRRTRALVEYAANLMEESGCFKGQDVRALLGMDKEQK